MDIVQAKSILARQRAQRRAGILPTAQDDKEFWGALDVVAKRATTRKPQTVADLRRIFGDERRNAALWDTLPDPLQRHWARAKQDAGERLTAEERRAANTPEPIRRMTVDANFKVVRA